MNKINFFLPDFYKNFKLITFLHDRMKEYPEIFYDDLRIGAVYGCFPGSIWNGGRVVLGSATMQEMEYAISEYNSRGIAIRYTFTNPLLEKYHVLDTYCNLCLELAENGNNEVLVNSPVLEEYIRNGYPGFKILSSTTKCLTDIEVIREELDKDYYLIVIDSSLNNTDQLFSLPHHEKIELIANHYCADNCPRRRAHYEAVGRCQLTFSDIRFPACDNINRSFHDIMSNHSFIKVEDIINKYKDSGFVNFKLDGRGFRREKVIESLLYYFVRPDYISSERLILSKI
ncbi:MAG: hypothetical protein K6B28_10920 [Lachnospiraceae bacterium]|nr:hypothetical protein [Lachnospiraceae bacterium]